MNKIVISILLLCSLCFSGCSDDDETQFFFERTSIESVEIPEKFIRGETVQIIVSYFRKSDCHTFYNFDYRISQNQRTVTVIDVILDDQTSCTALDKTDTVDIPLDFLVGNEESYIFRFWQGEDDQGLDKFLEIEVPVVEE